MRPKKVVLLLTAAVDPRNTPYVSVRDPAGRLAEYERAVTWYASQLIDTPIVLCENTGHDLGTLRASAQAKENIEVIQWTMPQSLCIRGKGFGELAIMAHAHQECASLAAADIVVKITGRYRLLNVVRLVRDLKEMAPFDVAADFHRSLSRADSRVFAYSGRFFSNFLVVRHSECDDDAGVYLEHVLARAIHGALAAGLNWIPLPTEPDLDAVNGTGGRSFKRDPIRKTLRRIRRTALAWMLHR